MSDNGISRLRKSRTQLECEKAGLAKYARMAAREMERNGFVKPSTLAKVEAERKRIAVTKQFIASIEHQDAA